MPGSASLDELSNRIAAIEHDMEFVKSEVTRVLNELVDYLKTMFRDISDHVTL